MENAKVNISDLEDGIYFLCPHCGKPSEFVLAKGYGYADFEATLELTGENVKKVTMDLFEFNSISEGVEYPRILHYFCPNCGELICDARDDGVFEVRNEEVFQYLIVVKDGKIVDAGNYWKEKFDLRSFFFFFLFLLNREVEKLKNKR